MHALAVPPIVTGIMFLAKKLAGLEWFANGAAAHPFLRFMLLLFSMLGIMSTTCSRASQLNPTRYRPALRRAWSF